MQLEVLSPLYVCKNEWVEVALLVARHNLFLSFLQWLLCAMSKLSFYPQTHTRLCRRRMHFQRYIGHPWPKTLSTTPAVEVRT